MNWSQPPMPAANRSRLSRSVKSFRATKCSSSSSATMGLGSQQNRRNPGPRPSRRIHASRSHRNRRPRKQGGRRAPGLADPGLADAIRWCRGWLQLVGNYDPTGWVRIAGGQDFFPVGDIADEHSCPDSYFWLKAQNLMAVVCEASQRMRLTLQIGCQLGRGEGRIKIQRFR